MRQGLPNGFTRINQEQFNAIDFVVMGTAFEIQNEMGRMHGEPIYRDELCFRLNRQFDDVQTEVPITISFDSFSKTFFADLVVDSSVIYELKTASCFVDSHRIQLLQYLLMTELRFGKLVNFRPTSVEREFVSIQLCLEKRQELEFDISRLDDCTPESRRFVELTRDLLGEWGGFLSAELFYDAVVHFFGGVESVIQAIEIRVASRTVGEQKARLLSPDTAFRITTIRDNIDAYRRELQRFLKCTWLGRIQWLNMNHHQISYETIRL